MVLDIDSIRKLVSRIKFVAEVVEVFHKMYPKSDTLYCEKNRSDSYTWYTRHTDYSLMVYDTDVYRAEFTSNEYIDGDKCIGYDPDSTEMIYNDSFDVVDLIDISELTEENIFQLSLVHEPQVLYGLCIMAVCKEMNMPGFNITLHTLSVLEGLIDGYFYDENGNKVQTREGSIIRIESNKFGRYANW